MYLASIYPRILHSHVPHLVPLMVAAARIEGASLHCLCMLLICLRLLQVWPGLLQMLTAPKSALRP